MSKQVDFWGGKKVTTKRRTPTAKPFLFKPQPMKRSIPKRNMTWSQAKRKYPKLSPLGDADRDGVKNKFDCRPFDRKKQGWLDKKKKVYRTFSWQRKGKKIYPSEKATLPVHQGRGTGHFGTGIYAYPTKRKALKQKYIYKKPRRMHDSNLLRVDIEKPLVVKRAGEHKDDIGGWKFHDALRDIQRIDPETKIIESPYEDFKDKPISDIIEKFEDQGIYDVTEEELIAANREWKETGVQPANIILEKRGYGGIVPEDEDMDTQTYGAVKFEEEEVPYEDFEEVPEEEYGKEEDESAVYIAREDEEEDNNEN